MENFYFYSPTRIIFGHDKLKELPSEIKAFSNRVLLVYGKASIKRNGIYSAVAEELLRENIFFKELSDVDPNPRVSTVREGVSICREHNLDFILAVGGGSVIDCAKAISAAVLYNGDPWDLSTKKASIDAALPLGCVLTISATGSEMNSTFVITNSEEKLKYGSGSKFLYPKFSFLNPEYTFSVPQYHTAAGIVDIMAHVYEFYFSHTDTAYITHSICEAILKTCIHYGEIALDEPYNYEARANLMWASSLALNGVTKTGTTFDGFNHGLEHVVSGIYDITHGAGLAIIIPHWMEYILDASSVDKFEQYAKNVWDVTGTDKYVIAKEGIQKTKEFFKKLNMPLTFSEVSIGSDGFDEIIEKLFLSNNTVGKFKALSKADVYNILHKALKDDSCE
jgi:alcohol dehydrogenase YqhD (iron-dependent ADH family)